MAGAVSLQDGALLAEWAISSTQAQRQFAVAMCFAQPACVLEVQQEAIIEYATKVLTREECCEFILHLRVPKSVWRTLSEVYTLRGLKYTADTGLPLARPIAPERAF